MVCVYPGLAGDGGRGYGAGNPGFGEGEEGRGGAEGFT